MAQVSNVQSRTLRVLGSLSEEVKTILSKQQGVVVLEKETKGLSKEKTFVSAEDISSVIEVLSSNNVTFRPHFYSLFAKFSVELKQNEVEKLNEKVYAIAADAEVSYSRIDENGHTGKIVVDRFEDYNLLRSFEGDITFYKFNRTKAQSRTPFTRQADTEGFQPVQNKRSERNAVQPQQATGSARGRPAMRGTGRGRGRPVQTGDRRAGARTTRETTSAPKTN
jgi:hypothetical protein